MDNIYKLFENTYLFCAIFGSTIFAIQFILTLIGFSHGGDDMDGDGIPDDMDAQDASAIDNMDAGAASASSILDGAASPSRSSAASS